MANQTMGMIILIALTIIVVYQIIAWTYFFVSVSLVYSSTRKITKMPGLSFFFFISSIYSSVLFYPTTLSYFSFIAPGFTTHEHETFEVENKFFEYGSAPHIIISIIIIILWVFNLFIQFLNAFLTTEISTQRFVTWSSVEPYTKIVVILTQIYQAAMLEFIVFLLN